MMNQKGFSQIIIFAILGIIVISTAGYFTLVKNSVTQSSNPEQTNSQIDNKDSYTGVLSVATNCMIPEGCGPKFKLYNSNLQSYMPLLGDIKESDSELIIRIIGNKTTLPRSEYKDMNYRGPTEAVSVSSYSVLSKIPYHDFLVNKAGEYTLQKYPCLAHTVYGTVGTNYNKTFSWELMNDTPVLKVKMSGSDSSYELWYDGNSGNFIKEVVEPIGKVFCQ